MLAELRGHFVEVFLEPPHHVAVQRSYVALLAGIGLKIEELHRLPHLARAQAWMLTGLRLLERCEDRHPVGTTRVDVAFSGLQVDRLRLFEPPLESVWMVS